MRKRRGRGQGPSARMAIPRRSLCDDDPLFDERDIAFAGAGDEKVTAPQQ